MCQEHRGLLRLQNFGCAAACLEEFLEAAVGGGPKVRLVLELDVAVHKQEWALLPSSAVQRLSGDKRGSFERIPMMT